MSDPEQPIVKTLSVQPSLLKGTPIIALTLYFIGLFCIRPVRIQLDPLCHQSYQHSCNYLEMKEITAWIWAPPGNACSVERGLKEKGRSIIWIGGREANAWKRCFSCPMEWNTLMLYTKHTNQTTYYSNFSQRNYYKTNQKSKIFRHVLQSVKKEIFQW